MTRASAGIDVQWRLTVAAAVATFTSALVLSPTIRTGAWLLDCVVVIAAVAVVGGVLRTLRTHRSVTLLATVATAIVILTALFASGQAILGVLPGPAAWHHLDALLSDGADVVWAEAPPVPATAGATFIVVSGVALVAVCVDAVAVTYRRAAAAGLALLAVYLIPASVLPDGVPWPLFAISALGWLLLLLVESRDRLGRWGRSLVLRTGVTGQPSGLAVGATGRRLGAVAIVVAVAVPLALPAFSEGILGSGKAGNGDGTGSGSTQQVVTVNPIVDLRRDLVEGADAPVLTYRTTDATPGYLRLATLDRFDGVRWIPDIPDAGAAQQAAAGLPPAPGLTPAVPRTTIVTDVSATDLAESRLPVPYPATQVAISGDWRYDPATLDVFTPSASTSTLGLEYSVTSLNVEPTARQLRNAAPPQSSPVTATALEVPMDVILALRPYVDRVAGDQTTAYGTALAIQNWFRTNFQYSLQVRQSSSVGALRQFLADRSGYCEQFAATMALMARVAGIPARVVVGFTPGTPVPGQNGTWEVTTHDAHAWPELWFEGVGWVRFEPTPGGGDGSAAPNYATPPGGSPGPGQDPQAGGHHTPKQALPLDQRQIDGRKLGQPQASPTVAAVPAAPSRTWQLAVLALVVVALLIAVAPALDRVRQHRRRQRATGSTAVEAAWAEVLDTMCDIGLAPRASETTRDLARRLRTRGDLDPDAASAADRLAAAVERLRYAPAPAADPGPVWRDATTVCAALLREASPGTRRNARWWPESSRARWQARIGRAGQWAEGRMAALRTAVGQAVGRVRRRTA